MWYDWHVSIPYASFSGGEGFIAAVWWIAAKRRTEKDRSKDA
jgi:hypothetical protein